MGKTDWRICWFGVSAIWNMTRSEVTREAFGFETIELLVKVLKRNKTKDQVVNVCIGSLSNLNLNPIFKLKIGRIHVLVPALKVIAQSTNIVTVCRTAAGLLANLGVDTSLANLIVDRDEAHLAVQGPELLQYLIRFCGGPTE